MRPGGPRNPLRIWGVRGRDISHRRVRVVKFQPVQRSLAVGAPKTAFPVREREGFGAKATGFPEDGTREPSPEGGVGSTGDEGFRRAPRSSRGRRKPRARVVVPGHARRTLRRVEVRTLGDRPRVPGVQPRLAKSVLEARMKRKGGADDLPSSTCAAAPRSTGRDRSRMEPVPSPRNSAADVRVPVELDEHARRAPPDSSGMVRDVDEGIPETL